MITYVRYTATGGGQIDQSCCISTEGAVTDHPDYITPAPGWEWRAMTDAAVVPLVKEWKPRPAPLHPLLRERQIVDKLAAMDTVISRALEDLYDQLHVTPYKDVKAVTDQKKALRAELKTVRDSLKAAQGTTV